MNRQQKEVVVENFKSLLAESKASFLVGYKGLSVSQIQDLRCRLRKERAVMKITKARLMKISASENDALTSFKDQFQGQVALVFAEDNVPGVAKQLVEYSKENDSLNVVSGFFESRVISKSEIDFLASIPPRDVLLAQLLGALQAPVSSFIGLLEAPVSELLSVLKQKSENS